MPNKKVKLRDQQPQSDPKGGKKHHPHKKTSGGGGGGDNDPSGGDPGQIGGYPPKYTP